jgi:hypothetical protein
MTVHDVRFIRSSVLRGASTSAQIPVLRARLHSLELCFEVAQDDTEPVDASDNTSPATDATDPA